MNLLPPESDLTTVADWVEGRLSSDDAREMALRVAADPALQEQASFVRRVAASRSALPLVEPPALVRQKLRQQFRRWMALQQGPARAPSVLELVATLVFDSRRQRLVGGTRRLPGGRAPTDVVHLVWRTDLAELVIEVRPDGEDRVRIDGQVLLEHESLASVFEAEVTGPGFSVTAVDGDMLGRFRLHAPRRASLLQVTNGEISLLADLDLDPREGSPS